MRSLFGLTTLPCYIFGKLVRIMNTLNLRSVPFPNDLEVNQNLDLYDPYSSLRTNQGDLLFIPDKPENRESIENCLSVTTVLTDLKKAFDAIVIPKDKQVPVLNDQGEYSLVSFCGIGNKESLNGPLIRVDFETNDVPQSLYTCVDPNNIYRFTHHSSRLDFMGVILGMLEMWGIKPDDTLVSISTFTTYGLPEIRRDFFFSNLVKEFGEHYDRVTGGLNMFGYLTEEMEKQSYASSTQEDPTWRDSIVTFEFT